MNPDQLKNRSQVFAIEVIKLAKEIQADFIDREILKQLVRSAGSMAANYRAACRARSKNEFFAKLSIVVEEADEALLWLEIIEETEICINSRLRFLLNEGLELLKIFSASRKTIREGKD
jgi:four helix bundle protein